MSWHVGTRAVLVFCFSIAFMFSLLCFVVFVSCLEPAFHQFFTQINAHGFAVFARVQRIFGATDGKIRTTAAPRALIRLKIYQVKRTAMLALHFEACNAFVGQRGDFQPVDFPSLVLVLQWNWNQF